MFRLILQAGFLTVAAQVALLLGALPAAFLLPASLPLQLAFSLPLVVGLLALGVPLATERLFDKAGSKPLHMTGMGAALCVAVFAVALGLVVAVTGAAIPMRDAQVIGLIVLYFMALWIARRWLR